MPIFFQVSLSRRRDLVAQHAQFTRRETLKEWKLNCRSYAAGYNVQVIGANGAPFLCVFSEESREWKKKMNKLLATCSHRVFPLRRMPLTMFTIYSLFFVALFSLKRSLSLVPWMRCDDIIVCTLLAPQFVGFSSVSAKSEAVSEQRCHLSAAAIA